MSTRNRAWLRSFLRLDARAMLDGIPLREIERQEDTVLRGLELLDEQPGCVLADEVGMGKTYEALGIVAARLHEQPNARILVLTPGADLSAKWMSELRRIDDERLRIYDFGEGFSSAGTLDELVRAMNEPKNRVVVASASMFQRDRGAAEQSELLSWFCAYKQCSGDERATIFARTLGGKLTPTDTPVPAWLVPDLAELFVRGRRPEQPLGLAELYDERGLAGFDSATGVERALDLARFRRVRLSIPDLDLFVVDEAHRLKNDDTIRSSGIHTIFRRKFRHVLFLTATPFALDVGELTALFRLFAVAKGAPPALLGDAQKLFAEVRAYQAAYKTFEAMWQRIDAPLACELGAWLEADPTLEGPITDPNFELLASLVKDLVRQKDERIEPAFRRWMIRSVRETKNEYRASRTERLGPGRAGMLPFLVHERLVAEIARHGRMSYRANVEMNLVSSYGAAATSALLDIAPADRLLPGDAPAYQAMLRRVLEPLVPLGRAHPKVDFVVTDAIDAAERGEKTLIFCARVETLRELRRSLVREWQARLDVRYRMLFEGTSRAGGLYARGERDTRDELQDRFHRSSDVLYLALRERYGQTLLPLVHFRHTHADEIAVEATRALAAVRVGAASARRLDYRIAKRAVEHAAARLAAPELGGLGDLEARALEVLLDPEFVSVGLDLVADELEGDEQGEHAPTWEITADVVRLVLEDRPNLFRFLANEIDRVGASRNSWLSFESRVALTERIARWLTRDEVPFLLDLLTGAKEAGLDLDALDSRALLAFVDGFWVTPVGRLWLDRLRTFIFHFLGSPNADRALLLDVVLGVGDFVRDAADGESREGIRASFNAPLFPMVLLANEVLQEGLDLHRSCRRVVHHDLPWSPSQIEQRIGRVDRLGSLVQRMRADPKTSDATIDIVHPSIERTIDERVHRAVEGRSRWVDLVLGAVPSFADDDEHDGPELPESLSERLRIDLRPRRSGTSTASK